MFVACARSHSSLVVSQAGVPAVSAIESGVARAGAPGAGLVLATDIRTGGRIVSSILFVGLLVVLLDRMVPSPVCCPSFALHCTMGQHINWFPSFFMWAGGGSWSSALSLALC